MNALASISGVSAHQLSGLFRKKFGVSVWQYVIDTRIDAASKLLRSPGFSVGMVAEQCGFRDVFQQALQEADGSVAKRISKH